MKCFFCDKEDDHSKLQDASTFGIDFRVRQCAIQLQDLKLILKLSSGDMVATETKFHAKCLVSLYNRTRSFMEKKHEDNDGKLHGIALAALLAYM